MYILGHEDFVDIFGGSSQNCTTRPSYMKGSFLCILGFFLMSGYRMGDILRVAKISIFLVLLEISNNFGG